MASEAKKGLVRVGSNYVRLAVTFVLGLLLVRMLLRAVGLEGLGLISLMGSVVGMTAMLNEVIRTTSIRELGAAYHRRAEDDGAMFRSAYNGALLLGLIAGCVTLMIFVVLAWALPVLFRVPDELIEAARWFVLAQGVSAFVSMVLAPAFNMYQITERMVAANAWASLDRATLIASAAVILALPDLEVADAVMWYGFISVGLYVLTHGLAVVVMVWLERDLVPRPNTITRSMMRELVNMGGWNIVTRLAVNMHLRADNYLMNLWLGVGVGNGLFGGLAVPLTNYTRMIANGMTWGISAVSARLSTLRGNEALRLLNYHTHRLQAMMIVPATTALIVLAHPILSIWVGDRLVDPTGELTRQAAIIVQILAVGMMFRTTGDGLINILYGAGHVRRYAKWLLGGGMMNVIVSIVLLVMLPAQWKFIGPACGFTGIMVLVHGMVVPVIGARIMEAPTRHMFLPLVRPVAITVLCAGILISAKWMVEVWTFWTLAGVLGVYGGSYGVLAMCFVFTPEERARVMKQVRKRAKKHEVMAGK